VSPVTVTVAVQDVELEVGISGAAELRQANPTGA
jgi:hypothetical protein